MGSSRQSQGHVRQMLILTRAEHFLYDMLVISPTSSGSGSGSDTSR